MFKVKLSKLAFYILLDIHNGEQVSSWWYSNMRKYGLVTVDRDILDDSGYPLIEITEKGKRVMREYLVGKLNIKKAA